MMHLFMEMNIMTITWNNHITTIERVIIEVLILRFMEEDKGIHREFIPVPLDKRTTANLIEVRTEENCILTKCLKRHGDHLTGAGLRQHVAVSIPEDDEASEA
jgi:hypothetical protein